MVTIRRLAMNLGVGLATLFAVAARAEAHPLHSTITQVVLDPARGTMRATVRVFVDDLRTAVSRSARDRSLRPSDPGWGDAVLSYVTGALALQDASGRTLPLRSCGMNHVGDALSLCLEAELTRGAGVVQVRNVMLFELYEDQINVVQNVVGGARQSILFTRGDRFKALR
jgi:hypothetical protein